MKPGKAELICTGSELLGGKINLYVPLFHALLAPLGFAISREQSCGDEPESIAGAIRGALGRAGLVIVCGGLGPTFDDLTRQAAARALKRRLVYSKACERILSINYALKKLPANFKDQCLLVEGAKALENANGTAFGEVIKTGGKLLVLLPGPRKEWEPMFRTFLNYEIRETFPEVPAMASLKLKISGLWEVQAEKLLRPVMRGFPGARYTILAGPHTVEFLITTESAALLARIKRACGKVLKGRLYGSGEDTLESVVGEKLRTFGRTIAAAESCTGGLASETITRVPGSSDWFLGGVVAYSNGVKRGLLKVKAATLESPGAVSARCAREMAANARKLFSSDYAFSITGIAGPGGGSRQKPAGLVYFGLARRGKVKVFRRRFNGPREFVRACAVNFILDELRKVIR